MQIQANPTAIKKTRQYAYAVQFLFGGLFPAFPALFPASATLVEKQTREAKERAGMSGKLRGRNAAAGAARGSFGLVVLALLAGWFTPYYASWLVLTGSALAWLAVSAVIWRTRRLRIQLAQQRQDR